MQYRTQQQFLDICDNMINGNWTDAGKLCADSGYYANDLHIKYDELQDECGITDIWDFVELIELANKYR